MFRKRKVLWYIDGTYMCNILIGSILKSIFDPNVMIFYHNYAGDALMESHTLLSTPSLSSTSSLSSSPALVLPYFH